MTRAWSQQRLAIGLALLVWATVFWFLIIADRAPLYFSSRTTWLAPVGALSLTVALIGRLLTARVASPETLTRRQTTRLTMLVLPALAVMILPAPTLGSYAVGKRSSATSRGAYVSMADRDLSEGDLSFLDIFGLSYNGELNQLAGRAGSTSSFVGFVSKDGGGRADEFMLNRFMISCCPGDAVNIQVRVVGAPPGQFNEDDWVRVTGKIYPLGQQVVVDATEVTKVDRPKRPYLNSS